MKIPKAVGISLKAVTCVALPAGGFAAGTLLNGGVEVKEGSDEFKNLVITDEHYKAIRWYIEKKVNPEMESIKKELKCIKDSEVISDNGSFSTYSKETIKNCIKEEQ